MASRKPRSTCARRPLALAVAFALVAARAAHATPFFFCESLPDPPGRERYQGFGWQAAGGAGGTIIHVGPPPGGCSPGPTEADYVAAIHAANAAPASTIIFPPNSTIWVTAPAPKLTASYVTILGNGATIRGDAMPISTSQGALMDIRGHDVIVRDLHFRNAGNDNLRIQGSNAYNIVVTHISSTGAGDDGLSISNTCTLWPGTTACDPTRAFDASAPHDITVQYSFFAGNTRSMFVKANNPDTRIERVSIHHNWFTKQWVRGPFVDKVQSADYVNNVIDDWAEWGVKFATGATGNVAYNLFRQSQYAVTLGQLVDPQCRVSQEECAFNGNPDYPYVVDDPNDNNQKKGFNLGTGMVPENVYTNDGLLHTNWYQDLALKARDGTAPEPFPAPEVFTLHLFGKVRDVAEERTGPCVLTPSDIERWLLGERVVCPRHPIDQAYLDAAEWCVNRKAPFRPPGL